MSEQNPHQKWAGGVNTAFRELRAKTKAANAVPFGQERLTPAEAKSRFSQMGPAEKKKFITERGVKEVISMLKEG